MAKRTPLYEEHIKLGARMVDFAGWDMPVQYVGLVEEHKNVRSNVGLFDVSHMGEIFFRGPDALQTLQYLTTNDVSKLKKSQAQYTLLPNAEGGIVDDIIIYCLEENQEYLVCANASNVDKDFEWMRKHNKGAQIENESENWGQIAIQGPKAFSLLTKIFGNEVNDIKPFHCEKFNFEDSKVIIAHTGYTGEKGVEVFVPRSKTVLLWQKLLQEGAADDVQAIGLGARDTLRLEMKYSLYGHEITDETSPIEAGLGWVVKFDKGDFIGREKMLAVKEAGPKRKLIGFKLLERGIPRGDYKLFSTEGKEIGFVTSGTMSPSLDEPIGIGYVETSLSAIGTQIMVEIRNRKVKAEVVKTPFIDKK